MPLLLPMLAGPQSVSNHKPAPPPAPSVRYSAQGAIAMPNDRSDDSYAIYSLLTPGQELASMPPEHTQQWAIAAITVNENDRNPAVPPQGQLKPPPDNPKGFAEAVADYQMNKNVRVALTKKPFHIDHAFALLPPDQVEDLRAAKSSTGASSASQSQWAGFPGVTYFSEVYFDSRHAAALVYRNDWCTNLCSSGSWIYLEKHGGHWTQRSGVVVPGA